MSTHAHPAAPRHSWPPQRKAAEQLGISDEELDERLQRLLLLLPDIRQKLASMRPQLVAALAAHVDQLPGAGTADGVMSCWLVGGAVQSWGQLALHVASASYRHWQCASTTCTSPAVGPQTAQPAAGRLMQLKAIFPDANSSLLAMRQPELVLGFDMVGVMLELVMACCSKHLATGQPRGDCKGCAS